MGPAALLLVELLVRDTAGGLSVSDRTVKRPIVSLFWPSPIVMRDLGSDLFLDSLKLPDLFMIGYLSVNIEIPRYSA